MTLACHVLPGACSKDRVTVYHGMARATVMCGLHAQNIGPEGFRAMREAGTIKAVGDE